MMSSTNVAQSRRLVVGNISLSLDGRIHGVAGEGDMGWVVPHAVSEASRDHMIRVTSPATTVLLGRKNSEGFSAFWPSVADDPEADARDRTFSRWLNATEKIVFSTTVAGTAWQNASVTSRSPAEVVAELRETEGGDIIVLGSSSVIRALLNADLLDRLSITLCPETAGGGARLFDDNVVAGGSWALTHHTVTASGALCLLYDRIR